MPFVGRSRIISIRFESPYPQEAERIANAISEGFIESALERKFNATAYARNFVQERLRAAKTALEESEQRLVEYAQKEGILDLGDTGGAAALSNSVDATSLNALNQQLTEAQSRRIALEITLKDANRRDQRRALQSRMLDDLSRRRLELVSTYNEKENTFQPSFPELENLRAQIDAVDREMEIERNRIISGLSADLRTARNTEESIRNRISGVTESLQSLRTRSIDYTILSRDVDTNRAQYEALLQRLKEVSITDGVGTSQLSVVDAAERPVFPFAPNSKRILIQFLILGMALGVGLAFALEYIDDTIKTPEDLDKKLGLATIGAVPVVKSGNPIIDVLKGKPTPISEAISSARMALQFSTSDGAPKSLLITSVRASEGKTNTAASLGVAFARLGKRVLIIEADMRKPSFAVQAKHSKGLVGVLTGEQGLDEAIISGEVANLYLLPCTIIPPNPAELLAGARLERLLREATGAFDMVIVDSPPVLGFADTPTLSSVCQATLLVFQAGAIRRPAAQRTMERLRAANANIIGAILTKYKPKHLSYGYGYGNMYSYAQDGKSKARNKKRREKVMIFEPEKVKKPEKTA